MPPRHRPPRHARAAGAIALVVGLCFALAVAGAHMGDRDVLKLILWTLGPLSYLALTGTSSPAILLEGVGIKRPFVSSLVPGALAALVMAGVLATCGVAPRAISTRMLFVDVVEPAVSEEVLFRGFLVSQLMLARLNPALVVTLSGVLFGAVHAPNVWAGGDAQVILAEVAITGFGGAVFALLMLLMSGSVIVAIGMHAALNLVWEIFVGAPDAIGGAVDLAARGAAIAAAFAAVAALRKQRR